MRLINLLSKKLLAATLIALCATALVSCDNKEGEEEVPQLGPLSALFSSDDFSVEAGGKISLPFTVTGVEGATLELDATANNEACVVTVKADASYSGEVEFTAPAITEATDVNVVLSVKDAKHNRSTSATAVVSVGASEPLTAVLAGDIKSIAVKGGEQVALPVVISGIGAATVSDPTVTVSAGWSAVWAWTSKEEGKGTVTLTAPAAPTETVTLNVEVKDNFDRTATINQELSVVAITVSAGAANCHIVAPGSTLTISAVKGNSAEKLTFDNAVLVWQDAMSMVKSVAANASEGVVVVNLNSGLSGNAVVAARQGETIVWSWHLWVTDYDPTADPMIYTDKETSTVYTWMDRNLGARNNTKYDAGALGLMYQWGRKDPFVNADGVHSSIYVKKYDIDGNLVREVAERRPTYPADDYESTNLELAIQNPTVFYTAPSSAWPVVDWLTDDAQRQDNDLWGGVSKYKTVYDPCPEGWRVPEAGAPWGFRKQYKKNGNLNDSGKYDPAYPWYIEYDDEFCIGFRYKPEGSDKEYWWPFTGRKDPNSGSLMGIDGGAQYHTASTMNTTATIESFAWGNPATETGLNRPYGSSVRCIKE